MSQNDQTRRPLVNRPQAQAPTEAPSQTASTPAGPATEQASEAPLSGNIADQVLDLIKSDKRIAQAIGQSLAQTAEGRQLLGISGKAAPRKKHQGPITAQQVKGYVAAYGEVTRDDENFHPCWPDHVMRGGPRAIAAKNLAWEEGRHISAFDETQVGEGELAAAHN